MTQEQIKTIKFHFQTAYDRGVIIRMITDNGIISVVVNKVKETPEFLIFKHTHRGDNTYASISLFANIQTNIGCIVTASADKYIEVDTTTKPKE